MVSIFNYVVSVLGKSIQFLLYLNMFLVRISDQISNNLFKFLHEFLSNYTIIEKN